MLDRDLAKHPIPFEFKVRNSPAFVGKITSDVELTETIDKAQEMYHTDELTIALRRIGKGVCPKSFPISAQSYYFIDLYRKTHGGEAGVQLLHLPEVGGVLDQAAIFYEASDIISEVKIKAYNEKLKNVSQDKIPGPSDTEGRDRAPKNAPPSR